MENGMKQWASSYAQMGLRVHPLNGKIPLWKGWPDKATNDLGTVAVVWDAQPAANIGVVTGRYGERYLLVIDGDKPHGNNAADGTATIASWQMIHGAFPAAFIIISGWIAPTGTKPGCIPAWIFAVKTALWECRPT